MNRNRERKCKKLFGTKVGDILGINDINGEFIRVGDKVRILNTNLDGIILYNNNCNKFCIFPFYSMWYGECIYDVESFGKCFPIKLDNGMRMNIAKI